VSQHRSIAATLSMLIGRSAFIAMRTTVAALIGSACAGGVSGQTFPDRPMRLLVGLPPGGGADVVARVFAEGLARDLGQQVLVDNRVGSAGLIAADAAAKSAPDGYTLLFGTVSSNAIFASLYKKLPYDPVRDFAPISMIATYPLVLVVNTLLPCRSMAEFIAYAKARPGRLSYVSAGHGSPLHLAMEMLKASAGIAVVHVPYKGGVQAMGDLLGGEIQVIFDALPTQLANIKAGRVRALAITSTTRNAQLPDVPTLLESGVAGMEFTGWFAAFAPAGLPAEILRRLHASVAKVLDEPGMRERLALLGVDATWSTPQQLAAFQRAEIAKWGEAVKASGATVQ
jgi:tripartite-type tricarboxylate transporter receptor subunit TctC